MPLNSYDHTHGTAFVIGIVLGVLTAVAAALAVRRRARERAADPSMAAVHRERRRIARELHDVVGHGLVVISMQARRLRTGPTDAEPVATAIDELAQATMTEVRSLVGELRREPDAEETLLGRTHELITRLAAAHLPVTLHTSGTEPRLSVPIRTTALRIVQESLTNAIKHGAGPARISLRFGADVEIEISCPARENQRRGGKGLAGLRERVAEVGGEFAHGRRDGGVFLVHARLPVEPAGVTRIGRTHEHGEREWMEFAS
ncbi:hypothetical protein Aca07nite_17170 [Actinoplanes capillaceus]|uniref:histidine kinase n=1 Tax=Actinoplanes campanulatus TaxID=113559 RepID=A0ABQ3WBP0_9ACTN|nr:histidine kinase [Actinoplanes capillaceus]GID44442.1 hypothetical protein Aca07nite_17170 [Actinoplanes capillaceus]